MKDYRSPINGSELKPTNMSNIMYSEHDDILYKVTDTGNIIPLRSPINGSELKPTNMSNIMYSEHDDMYYKIDDNNSIIPLKSQVHGGRLVPNVDGTIYDESTGLFYEGDGTAIDDSFIEQSSFKKSR